MIKKSILPLLLAAALILCTLPAEAFAAGSVYNAGSPEELSSALGRASGESTIRLTADIEYNTGISVSGKTIIFDLNGHTLNVTSSVGHGLEVDSGGVVDMKGRGAFNVSTSADRVANIPDFVSAHGAYTFRGGKARVTSAAMTGVHEGSAACANGEGSCVTVTGDVKSSDAGADAYDRGHVIVEGNVIAGSSEVSHPAIYAFGNGRDGSLVEVKGDVTASGSVGAAGVRANIGGTIRVNGNITGFCNGVIGEGGTVWVGGSVTAKNWGVSVIPGGFSDVTIEGALKMGGVRSASSGTIGTGDNEGYLVYTDEEGIVRVKIQSPATPPAEPPVYDAGSPEELSAALRHKDGVYTIRLTADIDYDSGISVADKTIVFDLNGYTLNVSSSSGHGLNVGSGGVVDMKGSGEFNVSSSANQVTSTPGFVLAHGVYAFRGGKAKVTNAEMTGMQGGAAACANGEGSCVTVTGDARSTDAAAAAYDRGHVIVEGHVVVEEGRPAIYAFGNGNNGSLVEVKGNVTSTGMGGIAGVCADVGGTIRVNGNITGFSNGVSGLGGAVWVGGSVTAKNCGVNITPDGCSDVTIDGTLTAPMYIQLSVEKRFSDGVPGRGDNAGYLVYSDKESTVRVKIKGKIDSPSTPSAGSAVYDAGTPNELSAALDAAAGGATIRLTADIDYNTGIVITGRSITFDLNGHTLNVASSTGNGLEVDVGGAVDTRGNGALNVTSSAGVRLSPTEGKAYSGVRASDGGHAKVTSATQTGSEGFGAWATGIGSYIEVTGNVKGPSGAYAMVGGHVIVGGNAEGWSEAACAYGDGSLIEVAGDVIMNGSDGAAGANAETGGTVRVSGNVHSNYCGVSCRGSTVWVGGSVTGGYFGVNVLPGGYSDVTIDGTLTSQGVLINAYDADKTAADGFLGTDDDAGYLIYTNGSNTYRVRLKSPAAASGGAGITVCPLSYTMVKMEKEVVDITVRGGCSYVTSAYWFHNTGEGSDLLVGFPMQYWGRNDERDTFYCLTQLQWLRAYVNGERVRLSVKKDLKPEGNNSDGLYSPQWYTWRMHFAANESIKAVNKYWFVNPTEGTDTETVDYILRSGAGWKVPAGNITVRMRPEDFEMENTTFRGMQPTYIEETGTIVWEAQNIEPTEDIRVNAAAPYGPGGTNPFAGDDGGFLPYRTMTLRMLRNFCSGYYNGTTWWGNWMLSRFGDTQSPQLYYCMGVSYYKLGYIEKALDMFSRINNNDKLYCAMSAYYKALICKDAGDDAGYQSCLDSMSQYLSGIPEDKMTWGAYWLQSRLADLQDKL